MITSVIRYVVDDKEFKSKEDAEEYQNKEYPEIFKIVQTLSNIEASYGSLFEYARQLTDHFDIKPKEKK